ncbi:MAG: molybdate ABC transporter substrate-binding protein, partial [Pseudomonadota bacterium]
MPSSVADEGQPTIRVAVAANFMTTARTLSRRFESKHGMSVQLVSGASGTLFAQIVNGAPFDLFLSADQKKPLALYEAGLGTTRPRTYAIGALALWDPGGQFSTLSLARTAIANGAAVAIANPRLAPYGSAAASVLERWRLSHVDIRRVTLQNVSQAFQAAQSGNVPLAIVARAQLQQSGDEL